MNDDATFLNIENAAHSGAFGLNDQAAPSDAQCAADNYRKGRITLYGLALVIEQPRNSYRTGINAKTGKRRVNRMAAHYGYICDTKGNDGDEVDCFIGSYPQSDRAYVINQNIGGRFDETKVMLCFPDESSARRAYLDSYDRDWRGLASLVPVLIPQLKWWLKHGNMRRALRTDDLPYEGLEAMTRKVYWNSDAMPFDGTLDHILYDIRRSDAGENLLMDAVTAHDIMEDSDGELSLDALVSPYARLERRMEILRGIMERTGDKVKPVAMQVTQPFKQRGVANVAAIFELSDGQSVSIYFHNPDTTPGKMAPTDEVISWKWLLNKKDITIVVAPERGADLNVREVARRIMRLAEKNSAAFQRANAKRAERMQTISDLKTEITQLEGELKSAQNELEVAKLEWEEAQERAKLQTDVESDEDDDRPLTDEEKAAYLQRIRNSHTIGVADPNEPESNEEMRNINGVPTIVAKIKPPASEQALIEAYFKAHIEDAEQIKAAVAAVNWEGITSSRDAWAAYHRLEDAAHEKKPIAAALANLKAIGIADTSPLLSSFGRPEPSAHSAVLTLYFNTREKIKSIADEKLKEEGKAELAALPDGAPLVDMARAVYRKHGIDDKHHKPYAGIVTAIQSKSADGVWDWLKALRNKASAEVFERATGIKLAKTQRDRRTQIDAWASITPEQRAAQEAAKDAAWLADERAKTVKRTFVVMGRMNVRNKDNTVSSGHEYLLGQVAAGFNQAQSVTRGAAPIYGLSNGSRLSYIKNKNFSNFIKAVIAYGGLRQALELVGVEMPQADKIEDKTDKMAAVDAAYPFTNATDNFKRWLHESLNDAEYSPFATAKAMDEAAKCHNAIVEWDKPTPALDDVGHSVASLQAGLAVVEKQAAHNAIGVEAETVAGIKQAIDVLQDDDDYAPSEDEIGGLFEAETVSLDDASEPPLKALLASLRTFLGQQTALDAVGDEPDCVGKIKQDGETVGRIDIADDGKAMVYVGATGNKRVVFPSGTTAMYSDDDAALMVDALFAARDKSSEIGAFGEIFHGFTNKPEAAIAKIMTEKRGEVPDAFVHPELGNIAFVYGDERMGLRHIEVRRGMEWVRRIPDILRNGSVERDGQGLPQVFIVDDSNPAQVAVVRLDWFGEEKTWLLTAYPDEKNKWGGGSKTIGTAAAEFEPVQGNPSRPNPQEDDTAKESPDEPSKVISERPTHPATPFLGSPAVAGQENNTTDADTLPEKIPGTRAIATRMDNADLWLLETLKELGGLTDAQAQTAAQYFIKHKLAKLDMPMSRYNFKHGADLEREFIRSAAGITDTPTGATKGKQARALFQSVIDGTVPDILAPELADEMEAVYLPVQGDPEIEALFERAAAAYRDALLAATANL